MIKKIGIYACCLLGMSNAWADMDLSQLQNKIILQLQAQQWITTKTAIVNVGVNASVTDHGIENIQASTLQKLNQLSDKGEWHIVNFTRQEDKSGLENVRIAAQARLPQSELANLRSKAKSLSKPGETYTIDGVQFTPSDEEIQSANTSLRNNIYQQARVEIDAINKVYPEQHYYLHNVDFTNRIMPMRAEENTLMMAKMNAAPAAAPMAVGNKAYLQAVVEIASMPPLPQPPNQANKPLG